jgi:hypothetical protein
MDLYILQILGNVFYFSQKSEKKKKNVTGLLSGHPFDELPMTAAQHSRRIPGFANIIVWMANGGLIDCKIPSWNFL